MTIQKQSSLYSTHASRPRKRPASTVIVRAIERVMKAELGASAIARWHDLLDVEIGDAVFNDPVDTSVGLALPLRKVWCPTKPCVARMLAQALVSKELLPDGKPVAVMAPLALGSFKGPLAKIISRRVIDLLISKRGDELRTCGELREGLFAENTEKQLAASIARHATDVLTYVTARARELVKEGEHVILEMQTVDQTLHGRETRGSGLVVCEKGMALIEQAAQAITEGTDHQKPQESAAVVADDDLAQNSTSSSDCEGAP